MPIAFLIDREAGLVRVKGEGLLTDDEIVACVAAVRDDPDLEPGMNTLGDLRDTQVGFSTEGLSDVLRVMQRTADKRSAAKAAIVANTDAVFGMMRVLQARSESQRLDPLFHVFRDMEEALKWLQVD